MAIKVTGEQYYELDGQLTEIKRQLRQPNGYPFNPDRLKVALQDAIEGKFERLRLSVVATVSLSPTCTISVCMFSREWTFIEAVRSLPDVVRTGNTVELGNSVAANGYTLTSTLVESLINRAKRGEETGLQTDYYGNFFLVSTGNSENPVLVGDFDHVDGAWHSRTFHLSDDNLWDANSRFLVRNLDVSKLAT
ncbi:MAG: hypothetical protein KGH56_02215 [Patescibacteria group bacterium]|nr:hypothetical protein [Patescibacteria group bacterium]